MSRILCRRASGYYAFAVQTRQTGDNRREWGYTVPPTPLNDRLLNTCSPLRNVQERKDGMENKNKKTLVSPRFVEDVAAPSAEFRGQADPARCRTRHITLNVNPFDPFRARRSSRSANITIE